METKPMRELELRWEKHRPTLCSCCDKPAEYKVYVKDRNSRIGARMVLLCDTHFQDLKKPVDIGPEVVVPKLLRIDSKVLPASFKGYKSSLGKVIRDTDPGAMTDEEWQDKLHPKKKTKDKSPNGKRVTVLDKEALEELSTAFSDFDFLAVQPD